MVGFVAVIVVKAISSHGERHGDELIIVQVCVAARFYFAPGGVGMVFDAQVVVGDCNLVK